MTTYTPDNWVILEISTEKHGKHFKVLAGWSGGYLDGDYWRMNSGIVSMGEDDEYYYFYGYSGSCYKCHKETQYLRNNNYRVYTELMEKHGDVVQRIDVNDVVLEDSDKPDSS